MSIGVAANRNTPVQLDWRRIRVPDWSDATVKEESVAGTFSFRLVYFCQVNESCILNVWREGYWRFVVIGFTSEGEFVGKYGDGLSMHECKIKAENAVKDFRIVPAQQTLPLESPIAESDLPF